MSFISGSWIREMSRVAILGKHAAEMGFIQGFFWNREISRFAIAKYVNSKSKKFSIPGPSNELHFRSAFAARISAVEQFVEQFICRRGSLKYEARSKYAYGFYMCHKRNPSNVLYMCHQMFYICVKIPQFSYKTVHLQAWLSQIWSSESIGIRILNVSRTEFFKCSIYVPPNVLYMCQNSSKVLYIASSNVLYIAIWSSIGIRIL